MDNWVFWSQPDVLSSGEPSESDPSDTATDESLFDRSAPLVIPLADRPPPVPPPPCPIARPQRPPPTLLFPPLSSLHYRSIPLGPHFLGLCGPVVCTYSALPCVEAVRWGVEGVPGVHPQGLTPRRHNVNPWFKGFYLEEPSHWAWPPLEAATPPWPLIPSAADCLPIPGWVRKEVEWEQRLHAWLEKKLKRGDPWDGPRRPAPPPPWPLEVRQGSLARELTFRDGLARFEAQRRRNSGTPDQGRHPGSSQDP
jgi:hypothetical protein